PTFNGAAIAIKVLSRQGFSRTAAAIATGYLPSGHAGHRVLGRVLPLPPVGDPRRGCGGTAAPLPRLAGGRLQRRRSRAKARTGNRAGSCGEIPRTLRSERARRERGR